MRVGTVDQDVVRAHIVRNKLMFTTPQKRRPASVPTLQYNSTRGNLRVMAKVYVKDNGGLHGFSSEYNLHNSTVGRVESQTVAGTKRHKRGAVEARIIKANIPVQVTDTAEAELQI